MFESLETFVLGVWTSLDDVLLCVGALLVAVTLSKYVHWTLSEYFVTSSFVAQLAHVFILGGAAVSILSHLFGDGVSKTIFGGFSIGVGYAMQPYVVSIITGCMLRGSDMLTAGQRVVLSDKTFKVKDVGLYYTTLAPTETPAATTYVPNTVFQSGTFSVL